MDVSEILTFLAFEVVVLCVLAWQRHYRNPIIAFPPCAASVGVPSASLEVAHDQRIGTGERTAGD